MSVSIELQDVDKFYGKTKALNHVNLSIHTGMFGLLGRNGAGKTTLMKAISTLIPIDGGSITVCSHPIKEAKKIRSMIGYLPQDFSMYGNMTVYEAMDYLGVLSGLDKKTRRERIPNLLQQVNLSNNQKTKVKAMSGGMRRRLGIAQAILHDPQILIVDEPTAGLDPEERVRFRNLLSEIAENRIVILSTHIVGDVEATCEQIAVMDEGCILFDGTVTELIAMAEGKVYTANISRIEAEQIKKQYLVTSMVISSNEAEVRFILPEDKEVFPSASKCAPNVEDAYLYLMHQKRGDN